MVTEMVHQEALTHIYNLRFFSVKLSENTSEVHCQDKALLQSMAHTTVRPSQSMDGTETRSPILRRLLGQMLCPELRWHFHALAPADFLLWKICIHLGWPVYVLGKLHLSFKARQSSWGESKCFLQKHMRLVGVEKPLEFFRLAK